MASRRPIQRVGVVLVAVRAGGALAAGAVATVGVARVLSAAPPEALHAAPAVRAPQGAVGEREEPVPHLARAGVALHEPPRRIHGPTVRAGAVETDRDADPLRGVRGLTLPPRIRHLPDPHPPRPGHPVDARGVEAGEHVGRHLAVKLGEGVRTVAIVQGRLPDRAAAPGGPTARDRHPVLVEGTGDDVARMPGRQHLEDPDHDRHRLRVHHVAGPGRVVGEAVPGPRGRAEQPPLGDLAAGAPAAPLPDFQRLSLGHPAAHVPQQLPLVALVASLRIPPLVT
jgi:hypothetical protein